MRRPLRVALPLRFVTALVAQMETLDEAASVRMVDAGLSPGVIALAIRG